MFMLNIPIEFILFPTFAYHWFSGIGPKTYKLLRIGTKMYTQTTLCRFSHQKIQGYSMQTAKYQFYTH